MEIKENQINKKQIGNQRKTKTASGRREKEKDLSPSPARPRGPRPEDTTGTWRCLWRAGRGYSL